MIVQDSSINVKKPENSRLATLPADLQLEIRRYLELGDFRTAKALYDANLGVTESSDTH